MSRAGAGQGALSRAWETGRDRLFKEFRQMGLSRTEARKLAAQYAGIKPKVQTRVTTPGLPQARSQMRGFRGDINAVHGKSVAVNVRVNTQLNDLNKALVKKYGKGAFRIGLAGGGLVPGHSPHPKADNIPIMATAREFMQPVSAVDYYGTKAMEAIRSRRVPRDAIAGYAGGGTISVRGRARGTGVNYDAFANAATLESAKAGMAYGRAIAEGAMKASQATAGPYGDGGLGVQGRGMAAAARAGRRLGASYIAFHRDPSGYPSYDMGSSGRTNSRIAAHLLTNHAAYAIRYVISQMRIGSARSNWRWRPYHPITSAGDFRHVAHVHSSYFDGGGMLRPGGAAFNGGRRPERILSTPQNRAFENLVRVISRNGGQAGGNTYVINAPHYVGNQDDLIKALVAADSRGQLRVLRR
jgi:hypothetical protein